MQRRGGWGGGFFAIGRFGWSGRRSDAVSARPRDVRRGRWSGGSGASASGAVAAGGIGGRVTAGPGAALRWRDWCVGRGARWARGRGSGAAVNQPGSQRWSHELGLAGDFGSGSARGLAWVRGGAGGSGPSLMRTARAAKRAASFSRDWRTSRSIGAVSRFGRGPPRDVLLDSEDEQFDGRGEALGDGCFHARIRTEYS